jgi:outer membrane protein OmpA-like peptidoglycan-associated protein
MFKPAFRALIRVSAVVMIAAATSACSELPDWLGGESAPADEPATAADTPASTGETGPQGKTVAEASDQYPTLADTPSKAPPASTSDEQKQVANALVGDRTQAQYSADALRAGDVTAAAPPPPASAESNAAVPSPGTDSAPSASAVTADTAPSVARTQSAGVASAPSATTPGTLPPSEPAAPPPATTTVASNAPAAPVPPPPPARVAVRDDAALGFQPSHAPPLDPAVAQMMGDPQQQRLASMSPAKGMAPVSIPAGAPAAVVAFPGNSIGLDANGIAQVQAAVAAFKSKGGNGYVRVVGHSPSGAPNLPADKQLMQSFERSQACATSVARELIKEGVPARRVLVDATSTLASGEPRRAEIFL